MGGRHNLSTNQEHTRSVQTLSGFETTERPFFPVKREEELASLKVPPLRLGPAQTRSQGGGFFKEPFVSAVKGALSLERQHPEPGLSQKNFPLGGLVL